MQKFQLVPEIWQFEFEQFYTTRRFMFGLALLFAYVFLLSIKHFDHFALGEGAGLCAYRVFVC